MKLTTELTSLMATGAPVVHLATYEEDRIIKALLKMSELGERGISTWDDDQLLQQLRIGQGEYKLPMGSDPGRLLHQIRELMPEGEILILKDFHHAWRADRRLTSRMLRNMVPGLRAKNQFLFLLTPPLAAGDELPPELSNDVLQFEVPLPDEAEMYEIFGEIMSGLAPSDQPSGPLLARMVQSALGLTSTRAQMALTRIHTQFGQFDKRAVDEITLFKKEVIRASGALEFWPASEGDTSVGGLDQLRDWLEGREAALTPEARAEGCPMPRGVLLMGIPGTGKSVTSRMLSGMWKLPLIRLDIGAIFGPFLGDSEAGMRQAISLAETVSPCILWIDEVEKAFAGVDARSINAGAPTRVFGSFLTWMQEHTSPVYVLATANDVSSLRPEFYRRFDRTYFLDLPNQDERKEIFSIHLQRAGIPMPEMFDSFQELVQSSEGMVGSDIEKVIREARIDAYCDPDHPKREMTAADIRKVMEETVPLSKSHPEYISELSQWKSDGRAFSASKQDPLPPAPTYH